MKNMIKILNYDILHNSETSRFNIISLLTALITSIFSFLCFLYAISPRSDSPDVFLNFLYGHQWIPISVFVVCIIGWIFYAAYQANWSDWYDDEENTLLYTIWYIWYFFTFSWTVTLPIYLIGIIVKTIMIDSVIHIVRFIAKPKNKEPTIIEKYNILLKK